MFSFKLGPIIEESKAKEKMCPACFNNSSDASIYCIGGRCAKWVSMMNFCTEGICPVYKSCHEWQDKTSSDECQLLVFFANCVPEEIPENTTGRPEIQELFGFCSL